MPAPRPAPPPGDGGTGGSEDSEPPPGLERAPRRANVLMLECNRVLVDPPSPLLREGYIYKQTKLCSLSLAAGGCVSLVTRTPAAPPQPPQPPPRPPPPPSPPPPLLLLGGRRADARIFERKRLQRSLITLPRSPLRWLGSTAHAVQRSRAVIRHVLRHANVSGLACVAFRHV